MNSSLIQAFVFSIFALVTSQILPPTCVEAGFDYYKTCFTSNWPAQNVCPHHRFTGHYDWITGKTLAESIAYKWHTPKCDPVPGAVGLEKCTHTVQALLNFAFKSQPYTFLWTFRSMTPEKIPLYQFGGLYWHQVRLSISSFEE